MLVSIKNELPATRNLEGYRQTSQSVYVAAFFLVAFLLAIDLALQLLVLPLGLLLLQIEIWLAEKIWGMRHEASASQYAHGITIS